MPEKQRKENIVFRINQCSSAKWEFYKKYHYLNESLPTGKYFEITLDEKRVGFLSISRFPHPIAKDIMNISRIVVVPEFQGFGIGIKFMNEIAQLFKNERVRITTSLKPFMISLEKNKDWKLVRFGRVGKPGKSSKIHNTKKDCSVSRNRITATFEFVKREQ